MHFCWCLIALLAVLLAIDIPGSAYALPNAGRHDVQEFRIIIVLRRRVIMTRVGDGELAWLGNGGIFRVRAAHMCAQYERDRTDHGRDETFSISGML